MKGRGEFTVVVNIGRTTNNTQTSRPEKAVIVTEFGVLTNTDGMTRRKAINAVAKKHGMAPNDVYALIEEAKQSGK
jgi:hypothetical protein